LRNQELAFDSEEHEKNRKFGHLYSRTFRPSLPGMPTGAGSRSSILHSTTIGQDDDDDDDETKVNGSDDDSDEEEDTLTKIAKGRLLDANSRSTSIHGVVNRLRAMSAHAQQHRQASINDDRNHHNKGSESESGMSLDNIEAPPQQQDHVVKKYGIRKNTSVDELEFQEHVHDYEEHFSQRSKRKQFQEKASKWITINLGIATAWRNNAFNWVNFCALLGCWISLLHQFFVDLNVGNKDDKIMKSANVLTVVFLWLRFLGFLRGTNIKMATFILMLQEISVNVDTFLVVLALILVMFAMLYHILLVDNKSLDDDEWNSFDTSLWKVWGYSIGEVDESAFPTESSYFLFTAFGLTIVIIMMNILIAIVSDSYTDAVNRSAPLFWRARVELIAEYEPLLPKLYDDDVVALMDQKILRDIAKKGGTPPNTWQYHCLMWQEGLIATSIVCGVVLFELLYINDSSTNDDDSFYDEDFFLSLSVTFFFLFEICLRFYVWRDTVARMGSTSVHAIGGFFSNPFRLIDSTIVLIDVMLCTFEILASNNGSNSAKATIKLARSLRLVRGARWLRCMKVLRSCRFFAKLVNRIRLYLRPSRKDVEDSLMNHYRKLEQSTSWAGRIVDLSKKMKHDLNRSTFHILQVFEDYQEEMKELQQVNMLNQHLQLEDRVNSLQQGLNQLKKKLNIEEPPTPSVRFSQAPTSSSSSSPKSNTPPGQLPVKKTTPILTNIKVEEKTKKPGGQGGLDKFTHLDQMVNNVTLRTLQQLKMKENEREKMKQEEKEEKTKDIQSGEDTALSTECINDEIIKNEATTPLPTPTDNLLPSSSAPLPVTRKEGDEGDIQVQLALEPPKGTKSLEAKL